MELMTTPTDPTKFLHSMEQVLLGRLLLQNEEFFKLDVLEPEFFCSEAHGNIFREMSRAVGAGESFTPVSVSNALRTDVEFNKIEGYKYLIDISGNAVVLHEPTSHYEETIVAHYKDRLLLKYADELRYVAELEQGKLTIEEIRMKVDAEFPEFQKLDSKKRKVLTPKDSFDKILAEMEEVHKNPDVNKTIRTGIRSFDALSGGFQPATLNVLGGRPSMGKTALALTMANNCSKAEIPVEYYSLEMTADQLRKRLLAMATKTPLHCITENKFTTQQIVNFAEASRILQKRPFFIDDSPGLTLENIVLKIRKSAQAGGKRLIIIDHLHKIKTSLQNAVRMNELEHITNVLVELGNELELPILVLAQLSRASETRDEKRPMLSDLRQSGSIEQDADTVFMVYREEYYLERSMPDLADAKYKEWEIKMKLAANRLDIDLLKNRQGPIGRASVKFDKSTTHITEW